jgi:hypothetical protein
MNRRHFLAPAGAAAIAPALAKPALFEDYRDYVATGRTRVNGRIGEFSITAALDLDSSGRPEVGAYVFLIRHGKADMCLGRVETVDVTGTSITLSGPMP